MLVNSNTGEITIAAINLVEKFYEICHDVRIEIKMVQIPSPLGPENIWAIVFPKGYGIKISKNPRDGINVHIAKLIFQPYSWQSSNFIAYDLAVAQIKGMFFSKSNIQNQIKELIQKQKLIPIQPGRILKF